MQLFSCNNEWIVSNARDWDLPVALYLLIVLVGGWVVNRWMQRRAPVNPHPPPTRGRADFVMIGILTTTTWKALIGSSMRRIRCRGPKGAKSPSVK